MSYLKTYQNKNPFLFLFFIHSIFLASIFFTYLHCDRELEKQMKAQEVITATATLSKSFYDAGLAIGAYSLSRNQMFAERYQKLSEQISSSVDTLRQLIEKQTAESSSLPEIEQTVQQGLTQLNHAKTILDKNQISPFSGNSVETRSLYKQIKLTGDQLQNQLDHLCQVEQKIAQNGLRNKPILLGCLFLTLIFYGSYNLAIQYRLMKIVLLFAHSTTSTE